jgi:hypothetical protein
LSSRTKGSYGRRQGDGKLPLTINLFKEAGIKYYETAREIWQLKNNKLIKRKDFIEHDDELKKN